MARVGSGAYSIYLPKRWIDTWPPGQQESRQVDLHEVGDLLVIAPVAGGCVQLDGTPPDAARLRVRILSSFARGHSEVCLRPPAPFSSEALAAARDLLRHLGGIAQRLDETEIRFTFPPSAEGFDGDAGLRRLGTNVREMVGLLAEGVRSYGHDPARAVHALRLLVRIQETDVVRAFHAILRSVATLRTRLPSLSDAQRIDFLAGGLDAVADGLLRNASLVLADVGLEIPDLAYPQEHIAPDLVPNPLPPVAAEFVALCDETYTLVDRSIGELLGADQAGDVGRLLRLQADTGEAIGRIQRQIVETVAARWGDPAARGHAGRILTAFQLANGAANLLGACHALARLAAMLHDARPPGKA